MTREEQATAILRAGLNEIIRDSAAHFEGCMCAAIAERALADAKIDDGPMPNEADWAAYLNPLAMLNSDQVDRRNNLARAILNGRARIVVDP